MKDIRLLDAFPPVPNVVHEGLEKALKEKNDMYLSKKKRPQAALCIALVIVLALAGIAYAATQLDILNYLVGGEDKASEGLKNSVQSVAATKTTDDIKLDLTGAVYDGERLSLSFTMENLVPKKLAQVTLDSVTLGGIQVPIAFTNAQEQWLPSVFNVDVSGVSRNPVVGGFLSDRIDQRLTGVVQGEMTFVVTRPENNKLVVLDPMMWYDYAQAIEDEDSRRDYEERRDLVKNSGAEIADIFSLDADAARFYWLEQGYTVVDASGEFVINNPGFEDLRDELFGAIPGQQQTPLRPGQMVETARITLPFTIDADKALALCKELTPSDIELSDCTVHFSKVRLTPLSTLIDMTLIPKGDTLDAMGQSYALMELTDENGQPLSFLDMDGESWGCASSDGCTYEMGISYGGLKTLPKEIHFTPYSPSDGDSVPAEIISARQEFSQKVLLTVE